MERRKAEGWVFQFCQFCVTPDFHRVHHGKTVEETNSDFGFDMPGWDYIFGTYRAQPRAGHEDMEIGLEILRENSELRLDQLPIQAFKTQRDASSIQPGD